MVGPDVASYNGVATEISMYPCKHTGRSSLALAGMWNYSVSPASGLRTVLC